jgi:lycopene beta-cyclase
MNSRPSSYDYIITGMGCAGLSLAIHLVRNGCLEGRRLLLIEREKKEQNDRTWCFWETSPGPFEDVVYRRWSKAWFHAEGFSSLLDLAPYTYKMIRGQDYYRYCLDILESNPAVDMLYAPVEEIRQLNNQAEVTAGGNTYRAEYLFNSILFSSPQPVPGKYYLLQHFKGWIIETEDSRFRPDEPTLMDFRLPQPEGTTFVYVMPFSENRALVEFTLFSPSLLDSSAYDEGLKTYLDQFLGIQTFRIVEEEFGVIPMTNHRFPKRDGNIVYIGTAGGQTKASSGYTFRFIQKHAASLAESIRRKGHPFDLPSAMGGRFCWYDSVLLNILHHRTLEGWFIFRQLFRKNRPSTILRFLDNETSLAQEFRLLNTLPQWPFMKAGLKELFR